MVNESSIIFQINKRMQDSSVKLTGRETEMKRELLQALDSLILGSTSESQFSILYRSAMEHARKHVYFLNMISGPRASNRLFSRNLEDEAQTYLAKLFTPVRETGRMMLAEIWIRYKSANMHRLVDEEEYYIAIIRRVVAGQRNEVMRYQQPQEYKVRRAIRSIINSNDEYELNNEKKSCFIVRKGLTPGAQMSLDKEELESAFLGMTASERNVSGLTKSALRLLSRPSNYFRCIKFGTLYAAIIHELARTFEVNHADRSSGPEHELVLVLESAITRPAVEFVNGIIDTQYVEKGKIGTETGEQYKLLFSKYISDMQQTGAHTRFFDYLEKLETASREEEKSRHRNRCYYLHGLLMRRLEVLANVFLGRIQPGIEEAASGRVSEKSS